MATTSLCGCRSGADDADVPSSTACGDHDPNGMMYVLKQDSERIRQKAQELFFLPVPQPYEEVCPLVIRANVGDTVQKIGDPSKIRLIHGGVKETHVFHLHNHQWRLEPDDPKSTIIDSISISPQECFTLDILYGQAASTE